MDKVETCSSSGDDQQLHLSLSRLKTFEKCSNSSNLSLTDARKTKLVKAGFYYNDRDDCAKCFVCNLTIHSLNNNDNDDEEEENYYIKHHSEKKPDCSFVRNAQQRRIKTFHAIENFYYEKDRLHTFLDWPIPHIINEKTLAENGFYYLKRKDYCACAFCNTIVGDWRVGDDVAQEHEKHAPRCHFVTKSSPTGNIPMKHCDILDGLKLHYGGKQKEKSMGINHKYCGLYNKIEDRIKSFNVFFNASWSADRVKQTPEELAKAGFYYIKVGGDMVKCFYCGGGVYNWEIDDDPIKQHYMYFGHCKFIKSVVEQQQNKCSSSSLSSLLLLNNDNSSSSSQNFDNVPVEIDDKDMEILMQSDVIKYFESIYKDNFLRSMLKNRLSRSGAPFFSIYDFKIDEYITNFRYNDIIPPQQQPAPEKSPNSTLTYHPKKFCCCLCKINLFDTVLLPCRHMVTCSHCTTSFNHCPKCSQIIVDTINPFL